MPKSRPPKGKKGKKGGAHAANVAGTEVVVEEHGGVPFGIVVLGAFVISLPATMAFVSGTMPFDVACLRFLAALAVTWLLCHLVYAVGSSFLRQGPEKVTETTTTTQTFGDGGFDPSMFSSGDQHR